MSVPALNGNSKHVVAKSDGSNLRKKLFLNCDPHSQLAIAEIRDALDAVGASTNTAKTSPVTPDYDFAELRLKRAIDMLVISGESNSQDKSGKNVPKKSIHVPSGLIEEVSEWLSDIYSAKTPYRYPYATVHPVHVPKNEFATELNSFGELTVLEKADVKAELERLFDWDNFNVFHLQKITGGHALSTIAIHAFNHFNLFRNLKIDRRKFSNFWRKIESGYKDVPYHNSVHASDVLQELAWFLNTPTIKKQLTPLEKCACLFAAGVHDHDHPGVNNDFLIKTNHELAFRYNDKSVLENHHASSSLQILFSSEETNFLSHLDPEGMNYFRKIVIDMILGTDMAIHFKLQADFKSSFGNGPLELKSLPERSLLMTMLVHTADLGNCGKPFRLAEKWGERVITEFFLQGDKEENLGLPVTPMNNRATCCFEQCQMGFITHIIVPMLEIVSAAIPELKKNLEFAKENNEAWKSRLQRISESEKV
eukprot:c15658_g2_i1.p1 GENE.c15658_g2_i1~~c15658_g2_i1.p1  ORF type:complete len:480 (+),score=162.75 c15658_g2_i1:32-1471(+)